MFITVLTGVKYAPILIKRPKTSLQNLLFFFYLAQLPPVGEGLLIHEFFDHTQRRTTVCRTPLDEWSARRRDLYLTTHNTHNKHLWSPRDSNPQSQQASGRKPTP